ncbi:S24 family peptidase [Propionispira arboris]
MEADYAVRISGKSMETTIQDESIVLVKCTNELFNGDIGIFMLMETLCVRDIVNLMKRCF